MYLMISMIALFASCMPCSEKPEHTFPIADYGSRPTPLFLQKDESSQLAHDDLTPPASKKKQVTPLRPSLGRGPKKSIIGSPQRTPPGSPYPDNSDDESEPVMVAPLYKAILEARKKEQRLAARYLRMLEDRRRDKFYSDIFMCLYGTPFRDKE